MNKNYSKHFMCIQILTSETNTFSIQIKLLWEAAGAWTHLHLSDYFKNLWYYTFPTLHICLQGTHMENLMLLYFNWILHWMYVSRTYETNKKTYFQASEVTVYWFCCYYQSCTQIFVIVLHSTPLESHRTS